MSNNQKITVAFRLNNQRQKEGIIPIYMRVYLEGKKFEVYTNFNVLSNQWDVKNQIVKTNIPNSDLINVGLLTLKGKVQTLFFQLKAAEQQIAIEDIKEAFLGKSQNTQQKTIRQAFEYHNLKMREQVNAEIVVKRTYQRYEITEAKVMSFIKQTYKLNDMPLLEMRMRFVTEFEHYLLTTDELQTNTAHKYIKNLKKIMNMAVGLDWIPSNPFNNFRCAYTAPSREVLNQEEIDRIRFKDFGTDRLNEVRDVFIFCCYTGFAYSDVYDLKSANLLKGVDGNLWLTTSRRKTGTKESVPVLPITMELIERYKNHKYCMRYDKLLPVNSNQNYNAYLKEIAAICGISKTLTSHIARHTFATTITLANGVPIETVSSMLGHSSIKTTQIYAKVLEQKVSSEMDLLKQKLFGADTSLMQKEG